jgi:hypothetical protein
MLLLSGLAAAQNTMQIGAYQTPPDAELEIALEISNTAYFTAFQADIPIPAGFSYVAGSAVLSASRAGGHQFSAAVVQAGILRLIAYSADNSAFNENSGAVAIFRLRSAASAGNFALQIQNATIGNSSGENVLTGVQAGSVTVVSPEIELSATLLDYGRTALQSSPTRTFVIQNTGNAPLTVNSFNFSSAEFSTNETLPFSIAANTGKTITVTFAPLAKGAKNAQLIIGSSDYDEPAVTVGFQAIAYAVNELHTGSASGASESVQTLEFSINNMEAFTGFQFDLKLPAALTYAAGSAMLFRADGHSVSVNQFNDTLRVVAFSFANHNFTGSSGKVLSLNFALNGIAGNYPLAISNVIMVNNQSENILSDKYNGTLHITSPDIAAAISLNFGEVSILETKEVAHRIYNYGQEPLILNQLQFSNSCFSSPQTLPLTVPAGSYFDLPVRFQQAAKGVAGGVLKIFGNDPDENPFEITLSGNAYVPNRLKIVSDTVGASEAAIEIEIENYEDFVAFQFDLNFSANVAPNLENIALTGRKQNHGISASIVAENTLRIVAFSVTQQNFLGNSGAVVRIPFTANCGNYSFSLNNALVSNAQSENILRSTENGAVEIYLDTIRINEAICQGEAYSFFGQTLTTVGDYAHTLPSANGCDSVVTLHLIVNQPVAYSFAASSCLSYVWNGQTYTQSGDYQQTFIAANGCDSVVTLHLTVKQPVANSFAASSCLSYTWNGQTYTQSGDYQQTFTAASGCDSVVTLSLTIVPAPDMPETIAGETVISQRNNYSYSISPVANASCYTWTVSNPAWELVSDCNVYAILYITSSGSGILSVAAINDCDTSEASMLEITSSAGITLLNSNTSVKIYPNPAQTHIDLVLPEDAQQGEFTLYDTQGKLLMQQNVEKESRIDIRHLVSGMYMYQIDVKGKIFPGKLLISTR